MTDRLGRLLLVTLEAARVNADLPVLGALRSWLDSWRGIGDVERGMARQGYDLQLTRYDARGWRATFYTTGMEHSITSATASAWERTPWHAVQGGLPTKTEEREKAVIQAFADESITDELVTCGVVVLQESRVAEGESLLADVKRRFGLAVEASLHCSKIFAGDARRGTPWEQLPPERIYELVRLLCAELRGITERALVALIDPHAAPSQQSSRGGPHRPYDVKEIASLAHSSTTTILTARYGHDGFRVWSDPDRTKIPWADGRRRADTTRSPFADIGPGVEPPRIVPIIEDNPKRLLLEVADVYAYTAAQAFSQKGGQRVRRFRDLYGLIDPELLRFEWNKESKWEDA